MSPGILPDATSDLPQWRRSYTAPDRPDALNEGPVSMASVLPPEPQLHSQSDSNFPIPARREQTRSETSRSSTLSPTSSDQRRMSEGKDDRINDMDAENATEAQPETPNPGNPPKRATWTAFWAQEVACDGYVEAQLLAMTIATGILDSMTNTTYHVFTSKQTGNTVSLAKYAVGNVGITQSTGDNLGVAMGVFIIGASFFGQLGHITHQRRRAWLVTSHTFQALLILAASALRFWDLRSRAANLIMLSMLAFAESGQIATALNVNMPELNTTMITGATVLLVSDPHLLRWHNPGRTKRLLFLFSFFTGAVLGAVCLRYSSPTTCLITVAGWKCFLVFTFLFNKEKDPVEEKRKKDEEAGKQHKSDWHESHAHASNVLWGD